jgi:chromosomal replication initiation ATPase DnaA
MLTTEARPGVQPLSRRRAAPPAAARLCADVVRTVAADFGLPPQDLLAARRGSSQIAFARQVAMYLAHVGCALSFETVGRAFGRDRTTVAHACRVVEDGRDDAGLDRRLARLERHCGDAQFGRGGDR